MYIAFGEVQAKITYKDSQRIYYTQENLKETGKEEKRYKIKFNNFQINFYKTLSNFKICDTIYTEKKLKLFSNFYLPISLVEITNKEQVKEQINYTKEEAKNEAIKQIRGRIENRIKNKENILRNFR